MPPSHTCTCTHAHAHMHIYTCIEIANGRRHGGIHVWHVQHACACVHACVCMCVCVCMGHPSHIPIPTPTPIHPSATPRGVDPRNYLKFDNTSTYQEISILFKDLKSVKNSPPIGGCVVWWVVGWVDGWGQVKSLKI